MAASVDGADLQNLAKYRAATPLFNETFPPYNVAGAPAESTQGLAEGSGFS